MKITDALLAEHVVQHNIFDHVESIAPRIENLNELRLLGGLLAKVLAHHGAAEEELLMAPLEYQLDNLGQEESFHHEHELIDESLARLQDTISVPAARQLLLQAVQFCREHFDKEERLVFPMAEENLSEKTLLELGQRWQERRQIHCGP